MMKVLRIFLLVSIIGHVSLTEVWSTDVRTPSQPVVVNSHHSFSQTIGNLKNVIRKRNLTIIFELNHEEVMGMAGFNGKNAITIGFVSPELEHDVLRAEPKAALELPLKIALIELDDGSVDVIYYQPSYLFKHYQSKDLDRLKREMDILVGTIVKEVAEKNR